MEILAVGPERAAAVAGLISEWRVAVLGPDEPPCSLEEAVHWWAPRPHRLRQTFLALEAGEPVGVARMQLRTDQTVPGFVPELFVLPSARRRGVGGGLVAALAAAARPVGAPSLVLRQVDDDEGGAAFADALGASKGFRGLQNRCRVTDLDPALLQSWVARATERASGWSLVGWDGPCPEELFGAFVEVQSAMLGAPVPAVAATNRSGAEIRLLEAAALSLGIESWVLAARHDGTGELGGFTELQFERVQPWLGHQGDTGVVPKHRELGLGRWLKAAMALRVLAERPQVTHLETNTAEDNPPMRAINEAMGFRVAVVWQDRELPLA